MAGSGLGGKYALIGMAESDVGIVPDKSPRELCVQVTLDAIRDAGLTLADVDGLITCNAFAELCDGEYRRWHNLHGAQYGGRRH